MCVKNLEQLIYTYVVFHDIVVKNDGVVAFRTFYIIEVTRPRRARNKESKMSLQTADILSVFQILIRNFILCGCCDKQF